MNTIIRTRETRNWWNIITLGTLAVIVFSMIWLSACSSGSADSAKTNKAATPPPASSAVAAKESVPVSLSNAGEYGENVYDYAKANDWRNADAKLVALRDAVKKVRTDVKNKAVDRL